ncbi:MAG: hypothetical protein ACLVAU_13340 [Ruminococcus sp.]
MGAIHACNNGSVSYLCRTRLASLLYDIMFAQIVAPIVVATDMGGAGRLKRSY